MTIRGDAGTAPGAPGTRDVEATAALRRPAWVAKVSARRASVAVAAVAVLAAGFAGFVPAGVGFALFMLAALLLLGAAAAIGVAALTRAGDGAWLASVARRLAAGGVVAYALALAALTGHYVHEALAGRIELHWMLFGPAALAALLLVETGLWRKLVVRNLPTWQRWRSHVSRAASDPAAMRRTLVDEVLLHRTLYRQSRLRWWRHALIFWGFAAMLVVELFGVAVREGFPAWGWPDVWRIPGHPVRAAFDVAYDATGLAIVAGCALALAWRWRVNGTAEQRYADTPTTLFLLVVALSGFAVEAMRIAASPDAGGWSFAGNALAALFGGYRAGEGAIRLAWIVHALASCAFIAYVPARRLVHSCATPLGRLANSQVAMLAAKKHAVLSGLLVKKDFS